MTNINKAFEDFLENTVNLNSNRVTRIEEAEQVLGKFIGNSDTFKDLYIKTIRQGSARQKTIIKPIGDDGEFDVDLLVMLKENPEWSPAEYHSNLAQLFKESDRYKDITDTSGKNRCVTIDYVGEFHVDLVPAIERSGITFIFNKKENKEEQTDGDGYASWFEEQNSRANGHLASMVRLLKYLRDSREEFDTKSIILTTIAAMQVQQTDNFSDVSDAFALVVQRMKDFFSLYEKAPTIQNPAMPGENFDRHWKQDEDGFTDFKTAVDSYADIASNALLETDTDKAIKLWQDLFGDELKAVDTEKHSTVSNVSTATAATGYKIGGSFAPPSQWSEHNDNKI